MTLLCDTSVIIDVLRGHPRALDWVRGLDRPPTCSEMTRVEILRGLRSGEKRSTERLLGTIEWIGLDEAIARRAGALGRAWRDSHRGIATADLIIAATAEEHGLSLATLNVRHFPMIEGLASPYDP